MPQSLIIIIKKLKNLIFCSVEEGKMISPAKAWACLM